MKLLNKICILAIAFSLSKPEINAEPLEESITALKQLVKELPDEIQRVVQEKEKIIQEQNQAMAEITAQMEAGIEELQRTMINDEPPAPAVN